MFGDKPHAAEPIMKIIMPVTKTFLRPSLSPNEPPKIISDANIKRYAFNIQNKSAPEAFKDFCKDGSATFKAVPSIKAIADAKMVDVMIHLPALLFNDTVAI